MKKLLTLLFVLVTLSTYAQKSTKGIERSFLSVKVFLTPGLVLSCREETVHYLVNKHDVIFRSLSSTLELSVVDRNIGRFKSWLAKDKSDQYYFITAFVEGEYSSLIFQPVDKSLTPQNDLATVLFTNAPVCK